MNISEAEQNVRRYYGKKNPTSDDGFVFVESLEFLIEKTQDPKYMMSLGGYYYEAKKFDLALKYYETAAEYKSIDAYECLGYIWYYGRTGTKDYEKAFKYFSLASDAGEIVASYKIADMYKNGYYVTKDYEKYKSIIEELYPKVKHAKYVGEPLPEIFTRLARIRKEEGKVNEAIDLYSVAKDFLAQRIKFNAFFGDLNIMKWLIDDLYTMKEFRETYMNLYDLYYLLNSPNKVSFRYNKQKYEVRSEEDEEGLAVEFNGKWYRSKDDFFAKASIDGKRLTSIYEELYGFKVEKWIF